MHRSCVNTATRYGAEALCPSDLVGLPGVHIECKRVEKLNVPAAMQQSIADSERFNDGVPALFHRRNRQQWLVTMRLTDWMRLYNKKSAIFDACKGGE